MVDVDGVVIVHPDPNGWSANLLRDLGVSAVELQQSFFKPHWDDVIHGRASLRERLRPVLSDIAPAVSCDDLIDYWFSQDAHLDQRVLDELDVLRAGGLELHLATVQEHERAAYLWERLDLQGRFDRIHYAAALGYAKPHPEFYRAVEARTGLSPEALFLIDDTTQNVESARLCGWNAALWDGRKTIAEALAEGGWHLPWAVAD